MSDRDDEPDNVIAVDFTGKLTPAPSRLRPVRKSHPTFQRIVSGASVISCGHRSLEIDEETLDIECVDCKTQIDARLLVLDWARRERQLDWSHEKVAQARLEFVELERQVRNLKAQLRRVRERLRGES